MKPLKEYKTKRRFNRTPEPGPVPKSSKSGNMFVVQKHRASHLHYDFRLEADGVLKSWAVPKGPSLDPSVKRLAMEVEDHPVDYADFEGVIPEGEYGGGTVMVWDRGYYTPDAEMENVSKAIEKGELKFTLHGNKLNGSWVLVRTRGRQWLLIKHRDKDASSESIADTQPTSVISDRTLAEIARDEGGDVEKAATGDPENLPRRGSNTKRVSNSKQKTSAKRGTRKTRAGSKKKIEVPSKAKRAAMPKAITPMLAKLVDKPFSSDEWVFETKWDGVRAVCFLSRGQLRLVSRNQKEMTSSYPELSALPNLVDADQAILDGEIVALDSHGISRFQLLQHRFGLKTTPPKNERATIAYLIFDLLYFNGYELMAVDLLGRKKLLQEIVEWNDTTRFSDHIIGHGEKLFEHAEKLGLEGIIAKRSDSSYVQGRSGLWLKIKTVQRTEVVIGGYTKPRGSRSYFGSLVLGLYRDGKLVYVGHVGTGFDQKSLKQLYDRMQPLKRKTTPFAAQPKTNEPVQWIKPALVAEVKFSEWTNDHSMRHPVFLGLREDKKPAEVGFEPKLRTEAVVSDVPEVTKSKGTDALKKRSTGTKSTSIPAEIAFKGDLHGDMKVKVEGGVVSLTNLDKIYWPDDGYTKGDLLKYYYQVAPVILPYLKDRPIILKRYPDGITGPSFHQHTVKDPPAFVKTYSRKSEGETVRYAVCNNVASLLYVANLGSIAIHAWSARMTSPEKPDWILFDLDPGDASFDQVREVAIHLHGMLDKIGLASYPKTSGSKGLHVYVPLKATYTHDQVVQFATLVAHQAASERPDLIAVERRVTARKKGTVYLDYLQNGLGKSLAAPYSVRARPGAKVSAPLDWKEVQSAKLRLEQFTIKTMEARLAKKGDLFKEVLTNKQSLGKALVELEHILDSKDGSKKR